MNKKAVFGSIVVIGLFLTSILWRITSQNDLKKHGVLIGATVTRVNLGGKTGGGFECRINFNGTHKQLSSPSSILKGSYDFIGKSFPAMYLPGKDVLEILITPKDFEKFNLPFPDSLNWVMPYVLKQ